MYAWDLALWLRLHKSGELKVLNEATVNFAVMLFPLVFGVDIDAVSRHGIVSAIFPSDVHLHPLPRPFAE